MSKQQGTAKNQRHESNNHRSSSSAPANESVTLRPSSLTDSNQTTNITKWLKFMKRDTESKFKALSEIFDPKSNFKFAPCPYPNKSQELLDTELEEADIIHRKPNSKTTADLLSTDHDPDLWAEYQAELREDNLLLTNLTGQNKINKVKIKWRYKQLTDP